MKAKKTLGTLIKAGWQCKEVAAHKQHYVCTSTGQMGSRAKGKSYVATLNDCNYRLEFYVDLANFSELDDEHADIQILHKNEPSNALGCMRSKSVRRAIEAAIRANECCKPKATIKDYLIVAPSRHALFDGSDAHLLNDTGNAFDAT